MFADPLDRAEATQTEMLNRSIKSIRAQGRELNPTGSCHFCEETVKGNKLFCDTDCSADYEKTKRL